MTDQLHLQLGAGKKNKRPTTGEKLHLTVNPDFGCLCDARRKSVPVNAPFNNAISAGKNTYVYDAHTYHTKVPPQGIKALIEHYTVPGDVVLDPFCGSGMTGVAAASLGRASLLSDISPAAVFIAYNLNTPLDQDIYLDAIRVVLEQCRQVERDLYNTECRTCGRLTPMLYMVWSYRLVCKHCGKDFVLWDVARDERSNVRESKILPEFHCPNCKKVIRKRGLKRTTRVPVSVGYRCCQRGLKEATAVPNDRDLNLLRSIEESGPPTDWFPKDIFPAGVNTKQPITAGITTVDKVYTPRALRAMALLWKIGSEWPDEQIRHKLLFTVTSLYQRVTVFSEFRFWGGSGNTANYNVPAIMNEQNVFAAFERKAKTISWYFRETAHQSRKVEVSTQSATELSQIADQSVDYVFTDPPFGSNINYSEMNFLWESWLGVKTDTRNEAIVNKVQRKTYSDYQSLLTQAFSEIKRVLKENSWLTVVFHNSSEEAWTVIQASLYAAGFNIEATQTFDKQHGTFKMFVSENAVGYDLVLQCRKAPPRLYVSASLTSKQDAIKYLAKLHFADSPDFKVRFLHVKRGDELDYRKLYASWLSDAIPRGLHALGFEDFRHLVDKRLNHSNVLRGNI